MSFLNREALFGLQRPEPVQVNLPRGGHVYVRVLSAAEKERCEADQQADNKAGGDRWRAILVSHAACDAAGAPLFDRGDVAQLANMPFDVIQPIYYAALKANLMLGDPVGDAEKN